MFAKSRRIISESDADTKVRKRDVGVLEVSGRQDGARGLSVGQPAHAAAATSVFVGDTAAAQNNLESWPSTSVVKAGCLSVTTQAETLAAKFLSVLLASSYAAASTILKAATYWSTSVRRCVAAFCWATKPESGRLINADLRSPHPRSMTMGLTNINSPAS